MKFRLIATNMRYRGSDFEDLRDYIEKIDKAGVEGPAYIVKDGNVYVDIFYGSDMAKLAEIVGEELIVTVVGVEEPTIEIYNDWRE